MYLLKKSKQMKTYLKAIALLTYTLLALSCENKLDLEPKQSITTEEALSTSRNITRLLTVIYAEAAQVESYGGRINIIAELLANHTNLKWNGTFSEPQEFNIKTISSTNDFVENFWLNAYEVSNQTNIVLDKLDLYEDEDARKRTEGEAKFLRALVYFDLVKFFSKPYDNGDNIQEAGVPIMTEPVYELDDVTRPSKSTIGEVYEFIINDLTDASNLLPESNGVFATKNAAKALLARIYLQQGDYEKALSAANDVIDSKRYSLTSDLFRAFNNNSNTSEDIFAWQYTDQDRGNNHMNDFWAGEDFGGRSGNPDISVNDEFLTIFDDPENDRRASFFNENLTGGKGTFKWERSRNIPFIRLAEMYLITAESNFRLGTTVGASPLWDINELRKRSRASELTTITLEDILAERNRELAFEGHRLHDIKRLKLRVGDLQYNSDRLILPIPQREVDVNPNL